MLKFYACKASIGAVLLQVDDDNKEHLVAYFSRMLSREELKYTLTLLEVKCLRLLEGMRHFRPYLWEWQFDVFTDHQALKWLYNTKDTNEHLYRWFLKLARDGYDYIVYHKPGKEHGDADELSRLMCTWDQITETVSLVEGDNNNAQSGQGSTLSKVDVLPSIAATQPKIIE